MEVRPSRHFRVVEAWSAVVTIVPTVLVGGSWFEPSLSS
jgi:hypothetical protein